MASMSLVAELQRRNVFRMAGLYLVAAWLTVQVAGTLLPMFGAPDWIARSLVIVLAIGLLPALVLAWVFEITPQGLKRDADVPESESIAPQTARRMDRAIIVVLLCALAYFAVDKFALAPRREATLAAQVAAPVATAATAATAGKSAVDPHSIAVLPFVNMSGDKDNEYFSDGIAEELLNRLAQFSDLKVAARTSAFQFKGKLLDVADIGRQLKVSHVLEGSVRKQGARIRITAQLIDAASGFHLWSETYERDASDVFKVQDEISAAIASALEARITGGTTAAVPARSTKPGAYNDYLQGRALIAKRVGDNPKLAVAAFDRAIARDPGYSQAHSGRAFAQMVATHWDPWLPFAEHNRQALASAEQALRLDPDNAQAYMVRGLIELTQLRIVAARVDLERAHALAPGSVDVLNFYGDFLHETGDLRQGEALKRQAMALDPLSFVHPMNLIAHMSSQRRFPEAIAFAQQALALGGGERIAVDLFRIYAGTGDVEAAAKLLPDRCHATELDGSCRYAIATLLAANGRGKEAAAEIAKAEVLANTQGRWLAAETYACVLGDYARAASALLKDLDAVKPGATYVLSCEGKGAQLPGEMSQDPEWIAAWNDPRLAEFVQAYRANISKFRSGG